MPTTPPQILDSARALAAKLPKLPESTHPPQFLQSLTFPTRTQTIPYPADLGITHVYCSPYLKPPPAPPTATTSSTTAPSTPNSAPKPTSTPSSPPSNNTTSPTSSTPSPITSASAPTKTLGGTT